METNFSLADTYTPNYTSLYSSDTPMFKRETLAKNQNNSFMGDLLGDNGLESQSNSLGLVNTGISGIGSLLNFYSMREQNNIAKDTLNFNKDMFNKKFDLYKKDRDRKIRREELISAQIDRANGRPYDESLFERSNTSTTNAEG